MPEPSPRWCREGAGTGGLQHEEGVEKEPKAPALFLAPPQAAVGAHSRTPGAERGRAGVAERRFAGGRDSPPPAPHSLGVYKTGSGTPIKELGLPTPRKLAARRARGSSPRGAAGGRSGGSASASPAAPEALRPPVAGGAGG